MSIKNPTELELRVHEAFEREGYITENGRRDTDALCAAIFEVISQQKVKGKSERPGKATTRGSLVAAVFPSLPVPEQVEDESARPMAEAVYKKVQSDVWAEAAPGSKSRLQKLITADMGNGYWMCRTRVGKDRTAAVYITDCLECIRIDFTRPSNAVMERLVKRQTDDRDALITLQPHNGKAYMTEFEGVLRKAVNAAHEQLALTVQATAEQDGGGAKE